MPTEREKPCAKFWSVGCCKQGLHTASIKQATYIEYWPVDPFWCGPKKRSNYIGSEGHRSYKGPQSETLADWFLAVITLPTSIKEKETLVQRTVSLPHQRIRGKLVWVWWVRGSMRPKGFGVLIQKGHHCKSAGVNRPGEIQDFSHFPSRKGKGYIAVPAYEGSLLTTSS
eukprot:1145687-Pelagomonas_calceolata.AAC.2